VSALWTSAEVERALTPIAMPGSFEVTGVTFDSRAVGKGDLFFALSGETTDGHAFVAEALSRGAAAAVVSRDVPGASGSDRVCAQTWTPPSRPARSSRTPSPRWRGVRFI